MNDLINAYKCPPGSGGDGLRLLLLQRCAQGSVPSAAQVGYVVPHNLDMLLKHDCHINVELCSTVCVHKYMLSGYNC